MGRKAKAKREANKRPFVQIQHPVRSVPNWPLLVLSVLGILLASYLTWTDWAGNHLKGCAVGSSCDLVLSSSWARLLGFPTAFWGLLAYITLAGTAFIKRADLHWWAAWSISFFGVLYSAYLTTVSLTILHAACPYCLTSLVLMTSIFALATYQRPAIFDNFSWPRWLTRTAPVAAVIILILHLNYVGVLGEAPAPEDPEARALAIHLSKSGAKMYGAFWCPHCKQQKAIFGASASRLPYVECSPNGQGAAQADVCKSEHIESYPTWVINGKHIEEVLSMKQLAEDTGFQLGQTNQNP